MVGETIRAKVALIGDDKIGKSKLLWMFMQQNEDAVWNNTYKMTVEVELQIVTVNIPDTNYAVELQVLDFGGNQIFQMDTTQRKYFQLTDHVIAAYNIAKRNTYESLKNVWLKQYKSARNSSSNQQYSGVLLGLQADLAAYSTVNVAEAIALAKEYNMAAMQCSSKSNQDIDHPFHYIAQQVYLKHVNQQ